MTAQMQKYFTLGGVEIANGWRTDAYVRNGLVAGWELGWCFNDAYLASVPSPSVSNPVTDPAPWYDPLDDDSTHFFGVAIRSFTSSLPIERVSSTSRRIGRLRTKLRRFIMDVDLLADDCCGTDYGKRWLLAQFDAGCDPGCATLPAQLIQCGRFDESPNTHLRDVYGIGLVSMEDITPDGVPCCSGATYRVVFDAENPYLYGTATTALDAGLWDLETPVESEDCVPWDDCAVPTESPCAQGTTGSTIAPPPLPSLAGPLAPGGQAAPWCNPTFEASQCAFVSKPTASGEAVVRITITAGDGNMDNLRVRVYADTSISIEGDCNITEAEGQAPVAELRVGRVPEDGMLVIDGSTRSILMYCPEVNPLTGDAFGWINADQFIYGPNTAFWQHPVLGCGVDSYCVCVTVDAENTDETATLTVESIPRYL